MGASTTPRYRPALRPWPGSVQIPDWTVGGKGVDIVASDHWQAATGCGQSVSLAGGGPGSVSQTVNTKFGDIYLLTWQMAGNYNCGPVVKRMAVYWEGKLVAAPSFNMTGSGHSSMGWVTKQLTLTADDTTSVLTSPSYFLPARSQQPITLLGACRERRVRAAGAGLFATAHSQCRRALVPVVGLGGKDGPRGIEATGQRLIFAVGQLLVLLLALVPAALVFVAAYFPLKFVFGPVMPIFFASLSATIILAVEAGLGVLLLGKLFERFDVTEEPAS